MVALEILRRLKDRIFYEEALESERWTDSLLPDERNCIQHDHSCSSNGHESGFLKNFGPGIREWMEVSFPKWCAQLVGFATRITTEVDTNAPVSLFSLNDDRILLASRHLQKRLCRPGSGNLDIS